MDSKICVFAGRVCDTNHVSYDTDNFICGILLMISLPGTIFSSRHFEMIFFFFSRKLLSRHMVL